MKTCPCCGYKTLEDGSIYDICDICFWEDDIVQFNNPDYYGGANKVSLKEAQRNFIKFGACDEKSLDSVRNPDNDDIKDKCWRPVWEMNK